MRIVVFGLGISSTWGNGHATHWRALARALSRAGHALVFFERDTPYYAQNRDDPRPAGCDLRLYAAWEEIAESAADEAAGADAAIVTSYCPDGPAAGELVLRSPAARIFYDLDTPITLDALARGAKVPYLPRGGLSRFDRVLSFTGGPALAELERVLGARRPAALYGCVDVSRYESSARPWGNEPVRYDLSYLGTYAPDRQPALERLLFETARRRPESRFLVGGPQYPEGTPWPPNVAYRPHVDQNEHAAFYGSSRTTLSLTRRAMQALGYCPSARLFEAAACGVPLISDPWPGLDSFFEPGREIFVVRTSEEVRDALDSEPDRLRALARAARERVLREHSSDRRASELVELLDGARAARVAKDGAAGEDAAPASHPRPLPSARQTG